MIKLKYLLAASVLATTVAHAIEMPQELWGIYSVNKESCERELAEYKLGEHYPPHLIIRKKSAIWYRGGCKPTKVTGGNGSYKITEICGDEDGDFKISASYKIDGNKLTRTIKNGSDILLKCSDSPQ